MTCSPAPAGAGCSAEWSNPCRIGVLLRIAAGATKANEVKRPHVQPSSGQLTGPGPAVQRVGHRQPGRKGRAVHVQHRGQHGLVSSAGNGGAMADEQAQPAEPVPTGQQDAGSITGRAVAVLIRSGGHALIIDAQRFGRERTVANVH